VDIVFPIIRVITVIIAWIGAVGGVWAVVDALSRRSDAYTAADKQTKGTWVGITAACAAVLGLGLIPYGLFEPPQLLWLAASVGTLVYLLDVRPRLREVQNGSRW
jgi:hypothetical protein